MKMNPSKVLSHKLLLAKHEEYGLDNNSSKYLTNRLQKCKTSTVIIEQKEVLGFITKSFVLNSPLFTFSKNDIFLFDV